MEKPPQPQLQPGMPHGAQPIPVTSRLLDGGPRRAGSLLRRFPTSYPDGIGNLVPTTLNDDEVIIRELDLKRLDEIFDFLWVAGRPLPPRALHHQIFLGREIVLVEQIDLHLVWHKDRIFVKPLSEFLLDPRFWARFTCQEQGCDPGVNGCRRWKIWKAALGFLLSYASLIRHQSDLSIAKEKYLLPDAVKWEDWFDLTNNLLRTENIYTKVDRRFLYGELRLSRLNKIFLFKHPPYLHGYLPSWNRYRYEDFLQDNLNWLLSAAVVIGIALTAMQVGLATTYLENSNAFQAASYGFTVFSIVVPLAGIGFVVMLALYLFLTDWVKSVAKGKARFRIFKEQGVIE
ncbi:hypothetical protein TWF481_009740 [Arthrobotrys musiformis]|uniref:Uncharacterized protein n=1 Tax=Arthrobotrys musiformis TaxID=47236 RepID=A0AAV9W4R1_9PEZI